MAVPALELKPRQTVALFDAALRLCARSSGVWSLTLPAGACVIAAVFHLVDTLSRKGPLLEPVALFTAAWLFRAISMGAACHFLDGQVLGAQEPNAWSSFLAALKRAPSLVTTAAFVALLNALIWAELSSVSSKCSINSSRCTLLRLRKSAITRNAIPSSHGRTGFSGS